MLTGVNPRETVWRTWSEILKGRIRQDRQTFTARKAKTLERLTALKMDEATVHASAEQFDALLATLDADEASAVAEPNEPEFEIGHIPWSIRNRVAALYAANKIEDTALGASLLVRYGCRAHRNFLDASGRGIPYKGENPSKTHFPMMDEETFEVYAASGLVESLAAIILDYNSLSSDRRKN